MDHVTRGIATAALTLQSIVLQALVDSGALTPAQALEAVDKSIEAGGRAEGEEEEKVAKIVGQCLEGVREALVEMLN